MKRKRIVLILIVLVLLGFAGYSYLYKGHRDIASEKESYLVTANSIFDEFKADEAKANQKYLDKTIEVYGKISSVDLDANSVIIDEKLFAVLKDKIKNGELMVLSNIKVKGRFIGYDDLLGELKMDQCTIVE